MNRAERRRAQKQGMPVEREKVINIKTADITQIKKDISKEATEVGFTLALSLPLMVLHDKYGFGTKRLERFVDQMYDLYDSIEKDYVTIQDLLQCIKDETGIEISRQK